MQIGITIEVPDTFEDGEKIAGKIALAVGGVLLEGSAAARLPVLLETIAEEPPAAPRRSLTPADVYLGPDGDKNLDLLLREIAQRTRIAVRLIAEASRGGERIHSTQLREL